jgi:tetratricopeptide (TPR) repeat protein
MKRLISRILFLSVCVVLGFGVADTLAGQEREYEWNDVERIVAVGDIHGAYDNLVELLQNARLIDDDLRWIGGEAHLVQNGDIPDRGPHSRKAMDLLMKLEEQAEDSGGRVHVLIGNHEAMNVVGIVDLVSAEEYEAFVDRDSGKRRDRFFERYYEQLRREARKKNEDAPKNSDARREFDSKYPLGFIEHRQAFGAEGKYGKWIREHNTSIKINGTLFSHGDWSEKFSVLGVEDVNRTIRLELSGELPIEEGLTFDEVSPLQYRGLAQTELTRAAQASTAPLVDRVLQNLGAKRMVVGHTLTGGVIESRFGGKHISIDVGMLELYYGGHRIALEIVDDELRAIHDGGTIRIPETMDESNIDAYYDDVAAVDPTNLDVQLKRVDRLQEQGATDQMVAVLEVLVELHPTYIPFRYRDVLGTAYQDRGETARAKTQFEAYIDGLAALGKANPENLNLANLLARFCVNKGLRLDLAEEAIARAVDASPENFSFRLTMARLRLAKQEYSRVLEVLDATQVSAPFVYERHYLRGLAFVGLNETDEARIAFQEAIDASPEQREAREALSRLIATPN